MSTTVRFCRHTDLFVEFTIEMIGLETEPSLNSVDLGRQLTDVGETQHLSGRGTLSFLKKIQ